MPGQSARTIVRLCVVIGLVGSLGIAPVSAVSVVQDWHIVWRTPGVVEVDDDRRVVPRLSVEDAEIARHIHTLIQGHPRFQHAEITVHITQGAVSLSGTFHDPGDVLSLKHQVAEIAGVIRLEILARFAV